MPAWARLAPLALGLLLAPLVWWPGTIQVTLFKGLLLGGLAGLSLLTLVVRPAGVAPAWSLLPLALVGWAWALRKIGADPFRADVAVLMLSVPLLVHLAALFSGVGSRIERLLDLALLPGVLLAVWLLGRHLAGWWPIELDSPMGHKNRLAAYLAVCLPWVVVRGLTAERRWPWLLPFVLLGVALAVTGTRGAWLGAAAGVAATAALLAWRRHQLRRPLCVAGLAGLALVGALVLSLPHARDVVLGQSRRALAGGHSVQVRRLIWPAALALSRERPLTGHGAGQFAVQYPRLRPAAEMRLSGVATIPETPHSDPLQLAVALGWPATLLAGAWLVWLLLGARGAEAEPLLAGCAGMLIAFAAHGGVSSLLGSPGVSGLAALAAARLALVRRRPEPGGPLLERVLAAGALLIFLSLGGWSLLRADLAYERARRGDPGSLREALARYADHPPSIYLQGRLLLRAGDPKGAYQAFERFGRLNPHSPGGRNNLALSALRLGRLDEARELWTALVAQQPAYEVARTNLAQLDFRQGVGMIHDRAPIDGMKLIRRAFAAGHRPREADFQDRLSGPIVRALWRQYQRDR